MKMAAIIILRVIFHDNLRLKENIYTYQVVVIVRPNDELIFKTNDYKIKIYDNSTVNLISNHVKLYTV